MAISNVCHTSHNTNCNQGRCNCNVSSFKNSCFRISQPWQVSKLSSPILESFYWRFAHNKVAHWNDGFSFVPISSASVPPRTKRTGKSNQMLRRCQWGEMKDVQFWVDCGREGMTKWTGIETGKKLAWVQIFEKPEMIILQFIQVKEQVVYEEESQKMGNWSRSPLSSHLQVVVSYCKLYTRKFVQRSCLDHFTVAYLRLKSNLRV